MKKFFIFLSLLLIVQTTLLAQSDKTEPVQCGLNLSKSIANGSTIALQHYIQQCHKKPNETILQQYQIQTYTTLQATSLVCMGDYYAPRIAHLAYLAYTLAAKQKSHAAQVSLGVMLEESKFKEKLPLSPIEQTQYKKLAQEKHPYNHYETLLQLRLLNNTKEIHKYKRAQHTQTLKYAQNCISSLENDIVIVTKKIKKYHHVIQDKRNHDIELWADTEFNFAQTKKKRLQKTLKSFRTLATTK